MQFKVKDIGEDGLDVDLAITAAWLSRECPDLDLKPSEEGVAFKGRLELSGGDYLLRGTLKGGLMTTCARCLEAAKLPLRIDVAVIYSEDKPETDDEGPVDAPDVLSFEDGLIDLSEEIRDEILLSLPVSPLCQEDCAGLCAVCGGNRNLNPCECVQKERARDSKLAALAKLKI